MARYRIPEGYQKGYKYLFELNNELRNQLIEELRKASDNFSLDDLANHLQSVLSLERKKLMK